MIPSFISELVRAIVIMTLTGGLLCLLLLAIRPIIRHRLPKAAQYYFWLVVLAAFLIPVSRFATAPSTIADFSPIYNVVERNIISTAEARDRVAVTDTPASVPTFNVNTGASTATYETPPLQESGFVTEVVTFFMVVYPFAFVLVLLYSLIGYARFVRKLRRNSFRPHAFELAMLKKLVRGKPAPRLIISNYAETPMLVGVFRPMIVLPHREYTVEQLHSILLHELTHMRRLDIAVKWLTLLVCAAHWFNPLAWIAKREIDRVCELSCDEIVIRNMDICGKQYYGETLISVASTKKIPMPVLSTTMCQEKRALKERLTAIMRSKKHTKLAVLVSTLLFLAVVLTACAVGAGGRAQNQGQNTGLGADDPVTQHTEETQPDTESNTETDEPEDQQTPENPVYETYDENAEPDEPSRQTAEATPTEPTPPPRGPDYVTIGGQHVSTSLTQLSLFGNLTNEDIEPLRYMTLLTALWFNEGIDTFQITDLSPLAGLTNLDHLFIEGSYINDITPLAGLTNLTWLTILGTQVTDITPLAGLINLETLQLAVNPVADITPLAGLTSLTTLSLLNNQISDITPLAGLTGLTQLLLSYNQVTDVTPLAGLGNLRLLGLSNNQVSDLSPLAALTGLYEIWVQNNPITDFSPIEHVYNIVFETDQDVSPSS